MDISQVKKDEMLNGISKKIKKKQDEIANLEIEYHAILQLETDQLQIEVK